MWYKRHNAALGMNGGMGFVQGRFYSNHLFSASKKYNLVICSADDIPIAQPKASLSLE
jgi:hypothetical protein